MNEQLPATPSCCSPDAHDSALLARLEQRPLNPCEKCPFAPGRAAEKTRPSRAPHWCNPDLRKDTVVTRSALKREEKAYELCSILYALCVSACLHSWPFVVAHGPCKDASTVLIISGPNSNVATFDRLGVVVAREGGKVPWVRFWEVLRDKQGEGRLGKSTTVSRCFAVS